MGDRVGKVNRWQEQIVFRKLNWQGCIDRLRAGEMEPELCQEVGLVQV